MRIEPYLKRRKAPFLLPFLFDFGISSGDGASMASVSSRATVISSEGGASSVLPEVTGTSSVPVFCTVGD